MVDKVIIGNAFLFFLELLQIEIYRYVFIYSLSLSRLSPSLVFSFYIFVLF